MSLSNKQSSSITREATTIFSLSHTRLQEALQTRRIDNVRGLQIAKDLSDTIFLSIGLLRSINLLTEDNGWTTTHHFNPICTLLQITGPGFVNPPNNFSQQMRATLANDPNGQTISLDYEVHSLNTRRLTYCASTALPIRFFNVWSPDYVPIDARDSPSELATWASRGSTDPNDPIWQTELCDEDIHKTSTLYGPDGLETDVVKIKQYAVVAATLTHLFVSSALRRFVEID